MDSISGIWKIETPVTTLRTSDGKELPLRPEAAKLYRKHLAQRAQRDTSYDGATWCAAVGMPRIMLIDSPFELVVRRPYVAFLHEWNWWARIVYLDGVLSAQNAAPMTLPPPAIGPSAPPEAGFNEAAGPMGLSLGTIEGDTLVIETTALRDSTLLDNSGVPHSDALKITERLRLKSADVLENRLRMEDANTFTQPWETIVTYRRQSQDIHEDVCLDRIKTGQPAVAN